MKVDMARIVLPYCLMPFADGRKYWWVILNRNYKPIGSATKKHVSYAHHALMFKITEAKQKKLRCPGTPKNPAIFLWKDNCTPWSSKRNWEAYILRLEVLTKLKVLDSFEQSVNQALQFAVPTVYYSLWKIPASLRGCISRNRQHLADTGGWILNRTDVHSLLRLMADDKGGPCGIFHFRRH